MGRGRGGLRARPPSGSATRGRAPDWHFLFDVLTRFATPARGPGGTWRPPTATQAVQLGRLQPPGRSCAASATRSGASGLAALNSASPRARSRTTRMFAAIRFRIPLQLCRCGMILCGCLGNSWRGTFFSQIRLTTYGAVSRPNRSSITPLSEYSCWWLRSEASCHLAPVGSR